MHSTQFIKHIYEATHRPFIFLNPQLLIGKQLEHYVKSQFPSLNKAQAGVYVASTLPFTPLGMLSHLQPGVVTVPQQQLIGSRLHFEAQ